MADEGKGMEDVVADVTTKALQEMEIDDMQQQQDAPGEAPGSAAGSRPGSARKGSSRPTSAAKPPSQPTSVAGGSRPTSAARGSRPTSAVGGSRPTSAAKGSRPTSAAGGSRPASAAKGSRPPSAVGTPKPQSRPTSARSSKQGSRPGSAAPRASPAGSQRGSPPPAAEEEEVPSGEQVAEQPSAEIKVPSGLSEGLSGDSSFSAQKLPEFSEETMDQPEPRRDEPPQEGEWARPSDEPRHSPAPGQTTDELGFTPGGGDGGDPGDSDDEGGDDAEEELMEEDDDDEEEESEEDENEMVVLDPDHPLMTRFQKTLNNYLIKQHEKVELELKELEAQVNAREKQRQGVGVELYEAQHELAKHQMSLERYHDQFSEANQRRMHMDQQLEDVRQLYKEKQFTVNKEKEKGAEMQGEVENLALRLFYMDNAKEDVRSDIAVMKRAAEKAETEVSKIETQKHKQDLYVDRLVERADKLKEEIAMYDAQLSAQSDETKEAKEALTEAHMEIDAINMEKKQLFGQWNSSLIGMRRRDEAHSAMNEALRQQQQRIMSLETEIEGYKKSISKEQEENEKVTMVLSKMDSDIATVRKMLAQCQTKHEALKNEYATYTRMLHETETSLQRANTDKSLRQAESNSLRKQIEAEYQKKVKLEDDILEKLRSQLTIDKAAQYTDKIIGKIKKRSRDLDTQVAQVENEISKAMLDVSNTNARTERLRQIRDKVDEEIAAKNEIITKSENEIVRRNAIIERKQGVIDQQNKKLEQMIQAAGGVELGPLEIQINSLHKSIEAEVAEVQELQQHWLKDQSQLVMLSKETEQQSNDVDQMKKKITILSQKKLRIEGDINREGAETAVIERTINNMQNEMLKLNMLITKERGLSEDLQQSNVLQENDFMGGLKEAERASIELAAQLESVKEEKERLLNSLVEAERQIMLWDKKMQLAKETKAAVDSEVGQGEIRAMKAEIHRMQVRYTQLMKQQEQMIQEMEKSVSRRDTISTRGDAQAKLNKKVLTKGTFQRQMGELKKKIKTTISDANACDGEIRELRGHQHELSSQLEEKQLNVQQLQSSADVLDGDLDRLSQSKLKNLSDLVAGQQRGKYYQQVKAGKYTRLCRTGSALDTELNKQEEKMQTLIAITDRLTQEYPHAQPALKRVVLTYGSRGTAVSGAHV